MVRISEASMASGPGRVMQRLETRPRPLTVMTSLHVLMLLVLILFIPSIPVDSFPAGRSLDGGEHFKALARLRGFGAARVAAHYFAPAFAVVMKLLQGSVEGEGDALPPVAVEPVVA